MDTFSFDGSPSNNCCLEYGNGVFYPELEYDSDSKVHNFKDLMAYAIRKNDYNSGTQLNLSNYENFIHLYFSICLFKQKKSHEIQNN